MKWAIGIIFIIFEHLYLYSHELNIIDTSINIKQYVYKQRVNANSKIKKIIIDQ